MWSLFNKTSSVQCTLYGIQCTVYNVHCTVEVTLWSVEEPHLFMRTRTRYINCAIIYKVYSVQCTLYSVHRTHCLYVQYTLSVHICLKSQ